MKHILAFLIIFSIVFSINSTSKAQIRTFQEGALIIPMDLSYQDGGMFQSYGLLFQLLRQGVTVYWVIDPDKTWHKTPCNEPGDECAWDCEEEGSGIKCPYPSASPDFYASSTVLWDNSQLLSPGTTIALHGYRGGPFVISALDAPMAQEIIDIWNDSSQWAANPWASRTVFEVVSIHSVTTSFDGFVRKTMTAAPTIAVFSDGNEDIATSYLRAAGIPQSNGNEYPAAKCGADDCGAGTENPDMLTVESIMGDMGTCDNPIYDHQNGSLFTEDRVPAYCQIMSMHWNVADRELVECDNGDCGATQADCGGKAITYHGHEVVAEVRQFLQFRTHFFAECQAVNAYENTTPNSAWPWLDTVDRDGHFLTTTGIIPDCPCTNDSFECVVGGCDDGTRDCCLAKDDKERGAGFMIAEQPDSATLQIFHPDVPYMQMDGHFETVHGSEPAYNLSDYLGTEYQNDMDVTFITGPTGPGESDVWMTGYIDGQCAIIEDDVNIPENCNKGKVSYLGGHKYETTLPISTNADSQGTRLFLNALFEADCVSSEGQPNISLTWNGTNPIPVTEDQLPVTSRYIVTYTNIGGGAATDAVLTVQYPQGTLVVDSEEGSTVDANSVNWTLGTIGEKGNHDPDNSGSRWIDFSFDSMGDFSMEALITFNVGMNEMEFSSTYIIKVLLDTDMDGVPDELDPNPLDPLLCGDNDFDGCDDCLPEGECDPSDPNNDGGVDPNGSGDDGCNCQTHSTKQTPVIPFFLILFGMWIVRRSH
jgi:hypothetical protein